MSFQREALLLGIMFYLDIRNFWVRTFLILQVYTPPLDAPKPGCSFALCTVVYLSSLLMKGCALTV